MKAHQFGTAGVHYPCQVLRVRFRGGNHMEEHSVKDIANNDGLTLEQFTKWFLLDVITHGPGTYELVHWTDLRY